MVTVKVPASTANIGPGFDTLGLAFNLYNIYKFEEIESKLMIEGCKKIYANENNLVYKSFIKTANLIGFNVNGLKISMETEIPVSRGLGSSAACVVGGVFAADAMAGSNLTKDELFQIAANIEGHPDNVAPAVYGGLTASIVDGNKAYCAGYNISDKVKFCALIPDFETSTKSARKLLPIKVEFGDAVYNISRVAVLLKALENGDFNLIQKSLKDKLHQPYRKSLIDEYDEVERICMENGSQIMFISGSGPTLMNVIEKYDFANAINDDIIKLRNKWKIKILETNKFGTVVIK